MRDIGALDSLGHARAFFSRNSIEATEAQIQDLAGAFDITARGVRVMFKVYLGQAMQEGGEVKLDEPARDAIPAILAMIEKAA